MDSCQFLSYIIIALIIALVIHLVSKIMKPQFEGMANVGSCSVNKINGPSSKKLDNLAMIKEEEVEDKITGFEKTKSIVENMADVELGNVDKSNCTVCKTSEQVDDYVRESLLHSAKVCKEENVLTPEEVNRHRNDYISFRNGVFQPSNGVDAVDKINDLYLSGNTDITRNFKDMKIKDLYDYVTKNNFSSSSDKKEAFNNNSDLIIAGSRGDFLAKDNWVYEDEKVMNGGEFMDGIYPSDGKCQENQAV